jgi:hypothetical protein
MTNKKQQTYYDYDDIEQAKMARDIIKEVIEQYGNVLKQRYYFEYLEFFFEQLNKDVPNEEDYQ